MEPGPTAANKLTVTSPSTSPGQRAQQACHMWNWRQEKNGIRLCLQSQTAVYGLAGDEVCLMAGDYLLSGLL